MTEPAPAGPDVVEVVPRGRSSRGRRILGAAVLTAAVVAAGSGATWLAMRGSAAGGADAGSCPDTVHNASSDDVDRRTLSDLVPATPTLDGLTGRLVPQDAPSSVVLCEYHLPRAGVVTGGGVPAVGDSDVPYGSAAPADTEDPNAPVSDLPLGRTALHTGSDAAVAPLVTMLQRATVPESGYYSCGGWSGNVPPQYLVRLTYDDGVVWVAGPVDCTTTNGDTLAQVDISQPVFDALNHPDGPASSAATTPPPDGDPLAACRATGATRQSGAGPFVPFEPTSVRICHTVVPGGDATVRDQNTAVAVDLAALLEDGSPLGPRTGCPIDDTPERWRLVFADDSGHSASVVVDAGSCPTIDDTVRGARASEELLVHLRAAD